MKQTSKVFLCTVNKMGTGHNSLKNWLGAGARARARAVARARARLGNGYPIWKNLWIT